MPHPNICLAFDDEVDDEKKERKVDFLDYDCEHLLLSGPDHRWIHFDFGDHRDARLVVLEQEDWQPVFLETLVDLLDDVVPVDLHVELFRMHRDVLHFSER